MFAITLYFYPVVIEQLKAALIRILCARAFSLPLYAWTELGLTEAKLTTLVQVKMNAMNPCMLSL